jgi:hypothetical protein
MANINNDSAAALKPARTRVSHFSRPVGKPSRSVVAENRSARSPRRRHHHTNGGTNNNRSNKSGLAKVGKGSLGWKRILEICPVLTQRVCQSIRLRY